MAKKLTGIVVSNAQDKTIVVAVARRVTHPVYGKQYTVTKKFAAHDEKNEANPGDRVDITETRPISKHKSWMLNKIVEVAPSKIELKEEPTVTEVTEKAKKPAVKPAAADAATDDKEAN